MPEYRKVGYLRTYTMTKSIYLFKGLPLTKLALERGRQLRMETETVSPYPWIRVKTVKEDAFTMNWNIWKHRVPAEIVLNTVAGLKKQFHFKDFVVKNIEVGLDDRVLVGIVNDLVRKWQEGEGQIKKSNPLSLDTRLYTGYVGVAISCGADKWSSDLVHKINLSSVKNLLFDVGVLELRYLETERKKKYGEFENINFLLSNEDIIKQIFSNIRTDRWFRHPEVTALKDEKGMIPAPTAIRTYEKKSSSNWQYVKDEEVRY